MYSYYRHIVIISLLLAYWYDAYAQTSRVWGINGGTYMLEFTDSVTIQQYYFPWTTSSSNGVFSSCSGRPMFRDYVYNIVDLEHNKRVHNSDSIYPCYPGNSIMLYRNENVVDHLSFANNYLFKDDKIYNRSYGFFKQYGNGYLFDKVRTSPSGLYLNSIDLTTRSLKSKNELLFLDKSEPDSDQPINKIENVIRIRNFDYRIANRILNTAIIGDMREGVYVVQDTVPTLDTKSCFDLSSIPIPPAFRSFGQSIFTNLELGRQANKLFAIQKSNMGMNYNGVIDNELYVAFTIIQFNMNPSSGKVNGTPIRLTSAQSSTHKLSTGDYITYRDLECSPDDSIIYFIEDLTSRDTSGGITTVTWQSRVRYIDLRSNGLPTVQDLLVLPASNIAPTFLALEISPYGYLVVTYLDNSTSPVYQRVMTYREPNNPQGSNSRYHDQRLKIGGFGDVALHLYDYLRFKPRINYTCEATVNIENKCDPSLGIDSYEWFFTKEDGSIEQSSDVQPQVIYSQNGDYFFKVRGYNSKNLDGYSEWYFDTLKVRIPDKPVPSFEVSDSIICSYTTLTFDNTSTTVVKHPTNAEKWVWTFGDGQTYTTSIREKVEHTYTLPGTYSVSLFYSNGYCDSTLVKNQYIKVKASPQSGFSLNKTSGCAPISVQIKDTVTSFVTKREYFFSDNGTWETIIQPEFSHQFVDTGTFHIIQKLLGASGCVATQDTMYVQVSPGVTSQDSVHVLLATFQHDFTDLDHEKQEIHLTWTSVNAAMEYEITQNNRIIGNTTELSYDIVIDLPPNEWEFKVRAKDVCGNYSSAGRIGKPIILKGAVKGNNEASVLQFSPYKQWLTPIDYTILGEEKKIFTPMVTGQPNQPYTDTKFAVPDKSMKCYVVRGQSPAGVITYSNVNCIPYKPLVYIPNAISANNDGLNESFKPNIFGIKEYTLSIYNRWGQEVYTGSNRAWKPGDNHLGVYFYKISCVSLHGEVINKSGTITVIR